MTDHSLLDITAPPESSHTAARLLIAGDDRETGPAVDRTRRWLTGNAERQRLDVTRVAFSDLDKWSFHADDGRLMHDSERFFSVEGLRVRTNFGWHQSWSQPIIVQPEIGFLGLIVKEWDGVLHALVQAKAEPGNINSVQLSPTVQATRSNYTGVHEGTEVKYIDYFNGRRPSRVLVDVLQSEQGAWFLRKRNRNIVVEVFDDLAEDPNFQWVTIAGLRAMLWEDNVVNMDLRTVLGCFPTAIDSASDKLAALRDGSFADRLLHSFAGAGTPVSSMNSVLSWIADVRTRREFVQRMIPLNRVDTGGWRRTDAGIQHEEGKYFEVFGARVSTSDREVNSWMQPLLAPAKPGVLALLVKSINGTLHALVHMRTEAGAVEVAELAPTVHCQPGNYEDLPEQYRPPYLDYVESVPRSQVKYDVWHSEEGGRFYRAQNRYMLVEVPEQFQCVPGADHRWMTFDQITRLLAHSHYVNVQLRSIVGCAAAVFSARSAG